jgi:hypothetical protein
MTDLFRKKKTITKMDTEIVERENHLAPKVDILETESRHHPTPKMDSKIEIHPVPEMDIQKIHPVDSKTETRQVPEMDFLKIHPAALKTENRLVPKMNILKTEIHTVLQTKTGIQKTVEHLQAVPEVTKIHLLQVVQVPKVVTEIKNLHLQIPKIISKSPKRWIPHLQ